MKRQGQKITCLTVYDASFSRLLDEVGIDVMLVGDSLGMVIQGHSTTLPVTLNEMVYHTRCVSVARRRSWLISDLPFMSYSSVPAALASAARLMQEGGANMVKLEGGRVREEVVHSLVCEGIPVCAHLGLTPQSIHQIGGFRVQGRDDETARRMVEDAEILQQAGAGLLVLECVPEALAGEISRRLSIPTIGIGAGVNCDGQVLVLYDMLGISQGEGPRFSRNFMSGQDDIPGAVQRYIAAVREKEFPTSDNWYS